MDSCKATSQNLVVYPTAGAIQESTNPAGATTEATTILTLNNSNGGRASNSNSGVNHSDSNGDKITNKIGTRGAIGKISGGNDG